LAELGRTRCASPVGIAHQPSLGENKNLRAFTPGLLNDLHRPSHTGRGIEHRGRELRGGRYEFRHNFPFLFG
jgi:hypothetical protein